MEIGRYMPEQVSRLFKARRKGFLEYLDILEKEGCVATVAVPYAKREGMGNVLQIYGILGAMVEEFGFGGIRYGAEYVSYDPKRREFRFSEDYGRWAFLDTRVRSRDFKMSQFGCIQQRLREIEKRFPNIQTFFAGYS